MAVSSRKRSTLYDSRGGLCEQTESILVPREKRRAEAVSERKEGSALGRNTEQFCLYPKEVSYISFPEKY